MGDKITDIDEIRKLAEKRRADEADSQDKKGGGDDSGAPSYFIRDCLRLNEAGDGDLYKWLHRDKFVYVKNMKEWLVWGGHHWNIDYLNEAEAAVNQVAQEYEKEAGRVREDASKAQDKDARAALNKLVDRLEKRAWQLRSNTRRQSCLRFAHTSKDPIAIIGNEIDCKPWLLPCPNGVIDLKTGELRDGRQKDYLLTATNIEYVGFDVDKSEWESIIKVIMADDDTMVICLKRLFGSAIVGEHVEKVFPVLTGPGGDNGKTTIVEAISSSLGELAGPIPSDMLLAQHKVNSSGPTPDIMDLKGLRFAYASETEDNAKLSTARVKLITGGDSMKGRWPNDKRPTKFKPTHGTVFLLSNYKPYADSQDSAFWSRMINIPFTMKFLKNREPKEMNELPADPGLSAKLATLKPVILSWLVEGCLEWQKHGLLIPEKVLEESKEYREDTDEYGPFVEYCLESSEYLQSKVSELKDVYEWWYRKYRGRFPKAWKRIGSYLKPLFKSEKVGGAYIYYGVGIRNEVIEEMQADKNK